MEELNVFTKVGTFVAGYGLVLLVIGTAFALSAAEPIRGIRLGRLLLDGVKVAFAFLALGTLCEICKHLSSLRDTLSSRGADVSVDKSEG